MERLTFKEFILEAKGIFGQYGSVDATRSYLESQGKFRYTSAIDAYFQNRFWNQQDAGNKVEVPKENISRTYTDTISSLKQSGQAPVSRDYRSQVIRNRRIAAGEKVLPSDLLKEARKLTAKISSPRLRVFDFDNTIANTNSRVIIKDKKTGEVIQKLSSADYAKYRPQKSHESDFSEFSKVINPRAIFQIQGIMQNLSKKNRPYTILTARPQSASKEILRYLKKQGLSSKGVRVVGLGTSDPEAKARYLSGILQKGKHTHLEFFDDHHENVRHVAKLSKLFPGINIKARHIAYGD